MITLAWVFCIFPIVSSQSCTFNVHYVTTASAFPYDCSQIIGRFRIDQKTEMSDTQLIDLFKNVRAIRGVVQIWNSQLVTASFLKTIQNITGDSLDKAISIVNNTELTSVDVSSLSYSNGKLEIQNNPQLDLQNACTNLHDAFFNRRSISGNIFNCGCEINEPFIYPSIINFPENCIVLYGNIIMDGPAPPHKILYRLLSVTKLYGYIQITKTNLETLGYLQNLEEIESGIDAVYTIYIAQNAFLGRLDLIKLHSIKSKNPDSDISIKLERRSCLDPELIQVLTRSNLRTVTAQASGFCVLDKINNPSTYCTGSLSTINERCTRYIGNMFYYNEVMDYSPIGSYTEIPQSDIAKIQQFEYIFGTLLIEGTMLSNVSLPNLKEIYQVAEDVSIPNLKIVHPTVIISGNGNLTVDGAGFCRKLSDQLDRAEVIAVDSDNDCRPKVKTSP